MLERKRIREEKIQFKIQQIKLKEIEAQKKREEKEQEKEEVRKLNLIERQKRIDEERRILTKQVEDEGKPAEIISKIVDGKLNKQFNSITLLGQEFIKDPDLTVSKLLEKNNTIITSFVRFEVGEGV